MRCNHADSTITVKLEIKTYYGGGDRVTFTEHCMMYHKRFVESGEDKYRAQLVISSDLCAFSKSLFQPNYDMYMLQKVSNLFLKKESGYFTYNEDDEVASPQDVASNSVILLDDVPCERQHNMLKYFSMGRHSCVDALYLCHSLIAINCYMITQIF